MDTVVKFTAVDFLERLRPGGPWVLTAIKPDGPTETVTAMTPVEVDTFVSANDGKRNLYYSLNPTRGPMTKKAAKVDIDPIEYLPADLDPDDAKKEKPEAAKVRYLDALHGLETEPAFVVDSGNGIQALWKLKKPIKLPEPLTVKNAKGKTERVLSPEAEAMIADIEGRAKALMERLGSVTGTQNIDRILRLPGTTNLPNAKKLKAGRVVCPTRLIRVNGSDSCIPPCGPAILVTQDP
jgi:hypothetical protein